MDGKQLQTLAQNEFRKRGYHVINLVGAGRNGEPDIVMCANGKFIGVEIKGDGDSLSPLQKEKLVSINKAGGWAYVVKSSQDIENIKANILHNNPAHVYTKDINDEELLTL